ncbi:MAG: LPS export ABC transporter periplasmic protein LptC [Gammaproteobacteria bacterium]
MIPIVVDHFKLDNDLMLSGIINYIYKPQILGIAIILFLSIISIFNLNNTQNITPTNFLNQEIGHYLRNSTTKVMDEAGQLFYSIRAESIQVPPQGSMMLESLTLEYLDSNLYALRGMLNNDSRLTLSDITSQNSSQAQFIADNLEIDLVDGSANTSSEVRINFENGYFIANGLITNLGSNTIELINGLYGEFGP